MEKRMVRLLRKRKNVLNNFVNPAVNYVITQYLACRIGHVVIGALKGIKNGKHLGKLTNQNFQYIPHGLFKQKLKSKCDYYSISYHEVDESSTSQACSSCGNVNECNRKYRRLYGCRNCGSLLNADVNGAISILIQKQVAPKSVLPLRMGGSGGVNLPVRIRLVHMGMHPPHEAPSMKAG